MVFYFVESRQHFDYGSFIFGFIERTINIKEDMWELEKNEHWFLGFF